MVAALTDKKKRLVSVGIHLFAYGALALLANDQIAFSGVVLAGLLIWISQIDLERMEVPDLAAGVLVVSGLVVAAMQGSDILRHISSALIWGSLFATISVGYRRLRGVDGLGMGDATLMSGIGAWTGLFAPISIVLLASVAGIVFLIVSPAAKGSSGRSVVAFGPFLCLSTWAVWLFGPIGFGS